MPGARIRLKFRLGNQAYLLHKDSTTDSRRIARYLLLIVPVGFELAVLAAIVQQSDEVFAVTLFYDVLLVRTPGLLAATNIARPSPEAESLLCVQAKVLAQEIEFCVIAMSCPARFTIRFAAAPVVIRGATEA